MSKEIEGQLSLFDSVDDLMAELKKKAKVVQKPASEKNESIVSQKSIERKDETKKTITEGSKTEDIVEKYASEIKEEALPKRRISGSLTEGDSIENKFSREKYTVIRDMGNYVYVRASDNTVHEMLKADIITCAPT